MVVKLVNSLHAQRARNLVLNHRHSEPIGNGDAEVSRLQNGVAAILLRWQGSDRPTRERLSAAPKALSLTVLADQPGVSLQLVRSLGLILSFGRHSWRCDPRLLCCRLLLMPTRLISQVG